MRCWPCRRQRKRREKSRRKEKEKWGEKRTGGGANETEMDQGVADRGIANWPDRGELDTGCG